jgi:CRP-like cAMP-binding protein
MNIYVRQNDNDLLKYLNIKEFNEVAKFQRRINLKAGEQLFLCGDIGRDIYFIEEGVLEISNFNPNSGEITLDFFEGEIIGEIAFTADVKRQFDVFAKSNAKLQVYPAKDIMILMNKNYHLAAKLNAAINDSLAEKNIRITQKL